MIYTHKGKASKLQIFQVRNFTPSAGVRGVRPSVCEGGRQRDRDAATLRRDQSERAPEAGDQSAAQLTSIYGAVLHAPLCGGEDRACPCLTCNPGEQ